MSTHDNASDKNSKIPDDCVQVFYRGKPTFIPKEFILKNFPDSAEVILSNKNYDVTEDFDGANHSEDARRMIEIWKEKSTASPEQKEDFRENKLKCGEKSVKTRWRSTAIAFAIATIVAVLVLPQRRNK